MYRPTPTTLILLTTLLAGASWAGPGETGVTNEAAHVGLYGYVYDSPSCWSCHPI